MQICEKLYRSQLFVKNSIVNARHATAPGLTATSALSDV